MGYPNLPDEIYWASQNILYICGSRDHTSYGCSLSTLRPNRGVENSESAITITEDPNVSKSPAPLVTAVKSAMESTRPTAKMSPHQSLEVRVIRNHQTATVISYCPKSPKLQSMLPCSRIALSLTLTETYSFFEKYSFFVKIIKFWNDLPSNVINCHNSPNISKFKLRLKNHMNIY